MANEQHIAEFLRRGLAAQKAVDEAVSAANGNAGRTVCPRCGMTKRVSEKVCHSCKAAS